MLSEESISFAMTAKGFSSVCDEIGITAAGAAHLLRRSAAAVYGYRTGRLSVPRFVAIKILKTQSAIEAIRDE